jgi:hypothetical protein
MPRTGHHGFQIDGDHLARGVIASYGRMERRVEAQASAATVPARTERLVAAKDGKSIQQQGEFS